ncbi:MAG: AAA family ATPase, partial [Candidatus Omnitrophica bacterium]|nr:AAA family ATPase [Candidatus Omnitrophota bacterium]
ELMNLHGVSYNMNDFVDACLYGRLNLFLQGDSGSGKTQLAKDAMNYFPDKSMFLLGRNDMDTRELFQQINLEKLRTGNSSSELKELTSKINTNLFVVDELPNCVPAVRAQLFNLFDGFIEINGKAYSIGNGYSVGIATGNLGQKFTESANDLGRALKDRMHVTLDVDYFHPSSYDTLEILSKNTNPRVDFENSGEGLENKIFEINKEISSKETSFKKLIAVNYLIHGLDYCGEGKSKRKMKEAWPNEITNHGAGSDEALILPISIRGAKSILRLSEAFDYIAKEKGVSQGEIEKNELDSVMNAFKFVGAYSGILNDVAVRENFENDKYSAIDSVIASTKQQFDDKDKAFSSALFMVNDKKKSQKVLNMFEGRWEFMKDTLEGLIDNQNKSLGAK